MKPARWPLSIFISAGLFLLVGVLAWLQYRWLGEVSEAERARLQTSLKQRASDFADDFDREITRAYLTFGIDERSLGADLTGIAERYDRWQQESRAPQLVGGVYLVQSSQPNILQQYQPAQRTFAAVPWPTTLAAVRQRLSTAGIVASHAPGTRVAVLRSPIVSSVPALVLQVPTLEVFDLQAPRSPMMFGPSEKTIVVVFDRRYLETTFLPSLVARHFPEEGTSTYRFAILDAGDPLRAVFSRGVPAGATVSARNADAAAPLFAFRFELLDQMAGASTGTAIFRGESLNVTTTRQRPETLPRTAAARGDQRFSIYVEQRSTTAGVTARGPGVTATTRRLTDVVGRGLGISTSGVWQLVLQHPAGSLEAAVGQVRRRNLTLSFGILTLLCVSVGLILVNAQRSQRLAAQQMDFVATVSHELRTPLAVIRSAAQNLAAGIVHEPAQAKQYGALIEEEGRRLTDMIEQVLDYAGLSGDRRAPAASPVDVGALVHDLADSCHGLFEADRIDVSVNVASDLPLVLGDEGAIRRALQNLVTNALKYGAEGQQVSIAADRAVSNGTDEVRITVSDRGPGIDAADLGHIFEPFYRGAPARDRQIHGNGLGLSLVKRIAEAHGGHVTVTSASGQGAAFTIALPSAPGLPGRDAAGTTRPLPPPTAAS